MIVKNNFLVFITGALYDFVFSAHINTMFDKYLGGTIYSDLSLWCMTKKFTGVTDCFWTIAFGNSMASVL